MNHELPRYFGSVSYWLRRAAGMPVAINHLFDKRCKEIHRHTIADVNGPLTLTLPIVKPHGIPRATWEDVRISDHNRWWDIHRVALESAYGRTPFFEFYIDRFLPFLSATTPESFPSVLSLNRAIEAEIAAILLLGKIKGDKLNEAARPLPPYWQPRADRLGFLSDLSILDLIFCLGPEAPLYIIHNAGLVGSTEL